MVVETMRALRQGATADATGAQALSERARDIIMQRLERLGDRSRRLVALASVFGREFDFDPLQQAAGLWRSGGGGGGRGTGAPARLPRSRRASGFYAPPEPGSCLRAARAATAETAAPSRRDHHRTRPRGESHGPRRPGYRYPLPSGRDLGQGIYVPDPRWRAGLVPLGPRGGGGVPRTGSCRAREAPAHRREHGARDRPSHGDPGVPILPSGIRPDVATPARRRGAGLPPGRPAASGAQWPAT